MLSYIWGREADELAIQWPSDLPSCSVSVGEKVGEVARSQAGLVTSPKPAAVNPRYKGTLETIIPLSVH